MREDGSILENLVTSVSDHLAESLLMKNLSNKKVLLIQKYTIRTSKRLMKCYWKMTYKMLTGTMFLDYIAMTLANCLTFLLVPLSISLTNMHLQNIQEIIFKRLLTETQNISKIQ